jgi:uncharacterized protein (DUF1501 family)
LPRAVAPCQAERLKPVARVLKSDLDTQVFYGIQSGYDMLARLTFTHASLLSEFARMVAAFFDNVKAAKLAAQVVLPAFSEFGRTVKQNGSAGTDHGTAGVMFLAGPGVRGRVAGAMPSRTHPAGGEPKRTTETPAGSTPWRSTTG